MRPLLVAGSALALAVAAPAAYGQAAPPAPAAAPADPARLAAAQGVVAKLVPPGVYKRMLGDNLQQMVDAMMGSMGNMRVEEIVRLSGASEEEVSSLGEATLEEILEIYDPNWRVRMQRMMAGMGELMGELGTTMEPAIREALSHSYAREFTIAELAEMSRFFATPAGAHYAATSLELSMSPEMIKAMGDMMPEMMKRMPDMIAKMEAATKDLPEPRTNKDLTPAERTRLAKLLGVDVEKLEQAPGENDET